MSERPAFAGTEAQQQLAEEIYQAMSAQASFFAADSPIRQTLHNLAEFVAGRRKIAVDTAAAEIESALSQNSSVFHREEQDGMVLFATTRLGRYQVPMLDTFHTFKRRLYEPENPLPIEDLSVVVTTTRPPITTIEPVFISEYWQQQAGLATPPPAPLPEPEPLVEAEPIPEIAELLELPVSLQLPINTMMTLPNGLQIDLRRSTQELLDQHGSTLVSLLRQVIENDPLRRLVTFGNQVFPEAAVASFGKNDLRRIRDYLLETGEPLLDTQIIADVFHHGYRQADYETFRFALNYRLSREKDFEFVGVEGARLWTTKGMPSLGSRRVKAGEMGQLMGYLEEGFDDSLVDQSLDTIRKNGAVVHTLTFFEWEYGMLPLLRTFAALLPSPMLMKQSTAVMRIELPQHYLSTLVELRYPTGNRGGWIQGLEGVFHEYLVPGAQLTFARTEEPHVFTITYDEQERTEDRLLVLDETRKIPKFGFANAVFECLVDSDLLVNQQQYGKLRNLKAFPLNERRKADQMVQHVFETIGDLAGTRDEPRFVSTEDRLYVSLNVLRPASREYLRHLLNDNDLFQQHPTQAGTWFYTPPPSADDDTDDDADDDADEDEE